MENTTQLIMKSKTKEELQDIAHTLVLRDRELLVETEGVGETLTARFKIGDGVTPYSDLPYISSIYKLFPNFVLYNNNYNIGVNISFIKE